MSRIDDRPSIKRLLKRQSTSRSEIPSRLEVGSSRMSTLGLRIIVLANAIRCLCPPDKARPRSPTSLSKGISPNPTKSRAFSMSKREAESFASLKLSSTVPLIKLADWSIKPIESRYSSRGISDNSIPSRSIFPFEGEKNVPSNPSTLTSPHPKLQLTQLLSQEEC